MGSVIFRSDKQEKIAAGRKWVALVLTSRWIRNHTGEVLGVGSAQWDSSWGQFSRLSPLSESSEHGQPCGASGILTTALLTPRSSGHVNYTLCLGLNLAILGISVLTSLGKVV